jgi:MFS family permease
VLAVWVRVELASREPLVDMRIMRLRGVWTVNLAAFLLGFGMYGSFILLPQLVEQPESTGYGFGASVTAAGLYMLPSTLAMLLVGPMAGRLERRFGSKPPLVAGVVFAMASFILLAVAHDASVDIYIASALLGIGIGLAFAAMANLIVVAVPADQTGVATGVNTVTRTIGGALGSQIIASILTANVIAASGLPAERGFTIAFWMGAGVLAIGVLASLAIPGRPRPEGEPAVRRLAHAGRAA